MKSEVTPQKASCFNCKNYSTGIGAAMKMVQSTCGNNVKSNGVNPHQLVCLRISVRCITKRRKLYENYL